MNFVEDNAMSNVKRLDTLETIVVNLILFHLENLA